MSLIKKMGCAFILGLAATSAFADSTSTVKYDYSLIQSNDSQVPHGPWTMDIKATQVGKNLHATCNGATCPSFINEGELIKVDVKGKNYPPIITEITLESPKFINTQTPSKYNVCHIALVYDLVGSQNITIYQEGDNSPTSHIFRSDSLVCDTQ